LSFVFEAESDNFFFIFLFRPPGRSLFPFKLAAIDNFQWFYHLELLYRAPTNLFQAGPVSRESPIKPGYLASHFRLTSL